MKDPHSRNNFFKKRTGAKNVRNTQLNNDLTKLPDFKQSKTSGLRSTKDLTIGSNIDGKSSHLKAL